MILSRQSGVSEILKHALKVDFWDVQEIAAKIIAVLKHPVLAGEMAEKAREELRKIRWETAAEQIAAIYREAVVIRHMKHARMRSDDTMRHPDISKSRLPPE